ncbi:MULTISPECIES: ATP-binding protein [Sphingobium]|jgi:two-component system sensor histidine kinase RegB|uniref:histidine kinase n=2 Tax=Sphingobium fuliginis (strain ATCC 27551) TaxID=336203 RepID=A0A292ZE02_SPHSA|nr:MULTISPECIES: ATP-binding protein [Sphingobium]MCB4861247.1 ATP-binding protein [Sphingobium sp. PNB]PNQ04627.1 histidine kinase [Sphingobium sp. SA916]QDC37387.1 HAMP domain-containing histidine kinase [Sphingobium fuliginis ATCC 27551]QOT72854.1 HAMP domain-containing histidine kinase [Sphingobium fuliginis]GAY21126.1 sensor histidine kinase PrrB [Sphingobium fuliginis]
MNRNLPISTLWQPSQWPADAAGRKNLALLVQLRWLAIAGQLITILAVHFIMGIRLPIAPMLLIAGMAILMNGLSFGALRKRTDVSHAELFLSLLFDVLLLTAQLYLSGGATNPFISLYLVQVALGAVLLDRWSIWGIVFVSALCAGLLALHYRPLDLNGALEGHLFDLHIVGTWICLTMIAVLLVLFVLPVTRNLQARDAYLARLRQQAAEEEHIVRMGLLASGAAHELGTPLSQLAVVLGDWRHMPEITAHPPLVEEVAEMQAAVQRCKEIVTGILLSSGEARGEAPEVTNVRDFIEGIAMEWRRANPGMPLRCDFGPHDYPRIVADPVIRQAIGNLLDNAREAGATYIDLLAGRDSSSLNIAVRDNGSGFSEAMLEDFGKPYRSSKGKEGHGLGLFLVVNVVRKLGGSVSASNGADGGALILLRLPLGTVALEEETAP